LCGCLSLLGKRLLLRDSIVLNADGVAVDWMNYI
jgi:hypothetical protein